MRRALWRIAGGTVVVLAVYTVVLCFPQPFFGSAVKADNLTLYSDGPLPVDSATRVLHLASAKLTTSPLYSPRQARSIFMCNAPWRQMLFFNRNYGVGGVNYYPLPHVFLRTARVEENRLISPRGTPVAGDRTLDYFLAHEIAHSLTGEALGVWAYARLPVWVREGYADYVGKGRNNYAQDKQDFLAGSAEMNYEQSGLYRRYHLLTAYLLDRQGWTVRRLLQEPPPQAQVEAWIRAEPGNDTGLR